ncbi:MAG: hypothetical protein QOE59_3279 [Actinomycetota bacterium]|jgi:hypothetical protein|nr:hypothetical protein [Actinomycetota bacterium]
MARRVRGARQRASFVALFAVVVLVLGVGLPLGAAGVVRAAAARAVSAVGDVLLVKSERKDDGDGKDSAKGSGKGSEKSGKDSGKKKDAGKDSAKKKDDDAAKDAAKAGADQFEGRDQIGEASADEYVAINDVAAEGNILAGGDFSGGSYSFSCSLSDHHNSDNPIIAPGKRNGAQHVHDYAGNDSTNAASNLQVLKDSSTTCTNGDQSPIFWPVLRDLRQNGPDVGQDGGSLDGNVGSYVEPTAVDYTFHGHGTREMEAMPLNMTMVTGSAKAGTTGEGANAKYTCSAFGNRMTDQYPVCPQGSDLQRVFDFPSCWNGKDLDSEDHTEHLRYPDESGECSDDEVPVPALRITVDYDPPPGRSFAIDSFPEQQHDPVTDHALLEYLSSRSRAQAGADCINSARRCTQGSEDDASRAGPTGASDQVTTSKNFAHLMATHMLAHGGGMPMGGRR